MVDDVAVDYVPVEARPWRLTMGLRPLDPTRWLEVDARREEELRLKARLLAGDHARVVAALPGTGDAGRELLALVLSDLERHHPGLVVRRGALLHERTTGSSFDPGEMHPVDAAGRLVQEDLCLMVDGGGPWVLGAASVCFPSRWSLTSKLGKDLSGIHRPVPGYEEAIGRPTEAFFDRLRPERPVWRLNWTLIDDPALHQPGPDRRPGGPTSGTAPASGTAPGGPSGVGRGAWPDLWFRVERQTLRRLAGTGAVVFTIRTYVTPLNELTTTHPEVVPALRATLPTVPPATVAYKGWDRMLGPLLARLDEGV